MDRGYLGIQKQWRTEIAGRVECPVVQVETEVVVPVETVSNKEEYMAATLRPKINKLRDRFLISPDTRSPMKTKFDVDIETLELDELDKVLANLDVDRSVKASPVFKGGYREAIKRLEYFLDHHIADYDAMRNEPSLDNTSNLSPYLHFGQISPIEIALKTLERVDAKTAPKMPAPNRQIPSACPRGHHKDKSDMIRSSASVISDDFKYAKQFVDLETAFDHKSKPGR